ncbi:Cation efflux system protein CusB [Phycisphaerales bacterium]|nr:Cation efflux system protein CusB [Phycisphaerales bacterium]
MTQAPKASKRPKSHGVGGLLVFLFGAAAGVAAGVYWHQPISRQVREWTGAKTVEVPAPTGSASAPVEKQLWTCGMHPQVIQDHPGDCPICHMKLTPMDSGASAGGAGSSEAAGTITIDGAVQQNMALRTAQVVEGVLARSVRAPGTVVEPEPGSVDITLRVMGWIQTLYANTDGMAVKKGDPLFDLYSPDLRLAIEELIAARKSRDAIAEGDTTVRSMGESLVTAAEARLEVLGLTREQIADFGSMERAPATVTILSPVNGHVLDKAEVFTGSAVEAGQRVLRLGQREVMWLDARVPERFVGAIETGRKVVARVDAYAGRLFEGEVLFVHPHLDEMTRTALVRLALPNPDLLLRRGMYASVEFSAEPRPGVVLAPREAIIDSGESRVAFVVTEAGKFEPRKVEVGLTGDDGMVEIVSGLSAGERVVSSGQFLVDSESRLREAIQKFLSAGAGGVSKPRPTPPPTGAPTALTQADAEKVEAAAGAYLAIAEELGAEQAEETPVSVDALVAALGAVDAAGMPAPARRLGAEARKSAEAMKGLTIEKQREAFKALSVKMIALLEGVTPGPDAPQLFVVHCPMAPGDWVQRTEEVANPYYATEMKECGEVVRPIRGRGEDRK